MTGPLLILGASGFLGRRLAATCLDEGRQFLVLKRKGQASVLRADIPQVEADPFDERGLARLLAERGIGAIVNLAAYGVAPSDRDPRSMQQVNVDLPGILARAAAARAVFVNAGSCAEYARPAADAPLDEQGPLETGKLYGSSKAAGGLIGLATAAALQVPMRHLRFFNLYGPGEAAHRLLPSLQRAAKAGARATLSAGSQVRDFIHVDDAVRAILCATDRLQSGSATGALALNVSSGVGTSVRSFAEIAAAALGMPAELLGFGDVPMRPDEIPHLVGDPGRLRADLGWAPARDCASGITASIAEME